MQLQTIREQDQQMRIPILQSFHLLLLFILLNLVQLLQLLLILILYNNSVQVHGVEINNASQKKDANEISYSTLQYNMSISHHLEAFKIQYCIINKIKVYYIIIDCIIVFNPHLSKKMLKINNGSKKIMISIKLNHDVYNVNK